jgi:hypothetical protein
VTRAVKIGRSRVRLLQITTRHHDRSEAASAASTLFTRADPPTVARASSEIVQSVMVDTALPSAASLRS